MLGSRHGDEGSGRRPTEGSPVEKELLQLCEQATRVQRVCELLGFEFRGADPLIEHLRGHVDHLVDHHPLVGQGDPVALLEDPDQRPYIWDLED